MKKKIKFKETKLLLLIALFLLGNFVVLLTKPSLLLSILIPYLPPIALCLSQVKKSRKNIFLFASISTFFLAIPFEFMAAVYKFWETKTFSFKLLNIVPAENLLFFFLHQLLVLLVYERFFDRDTKLKYPKQFKFLILLYLAFSLITYVLIYLVPTISLTYFVFGTVVILIPIVFGLRLRPQLAKKVILNTLIWVIPFLANEFVVVLARIVLYKGNYLAWVTIWFINIPVEELLFWIILSAPAIILGYEIFLDDGK